MLTLISNILFVFFFRTRLGERMVSMSSMLVETVSINYEDFNESFLTCGTCLCVYDGSEHTPKLLPCSHTVRFIYRIKQLKITYTYSSCTCTIYIWISYISIILWLFIIGMFTLFNKNCRVSNTRDRSV